MWADENQRCVTSNEHEMEAQIFFSRTHKVHFFSTFDMSAFEAFITVHQYQLAAIPEDLWLVLELYFLIFCSSHFFLAIIPKTR